MTHQGDAKVPAIAYSPSPHYEAAVLK